MALTWKRLEPVLGSATSITPKVRAHRDELSFKLLKD